MRHLFLGLALTCTCAIAQMGANNNLADPNLTGMDALQSLPHMSEELSSEIVEGRPYLSAADLDGVLSVSLDESQRQDIYGKMFRQINLNSAPDEEIMLIPGMSSRMAHEFEEYRPYTSLDQFRREIGKYVSEDEVARFEQYIFIPMNLNDAPLEHFAGIPGMTSRMVHEFEEYRPYRNMEQFRREIGKYVDEDEVARLGSYVTLD